MGLHNIILLTTWHLKNDQVKSKSAISSSINGSYPIEISLNLGAYGIFEKKFRGISEISKRKEQERIVRKGK